MNNEGEKAPEADECVVHTHPVPAGELSRYRVDGDPHSEMDIANYVHGQARDETVQTSRGSSKRLSWVRPMRSGTEPPTRAVGGS
jgi:hypothetical protein